MDKYTIKSNVCPFFDGNFPRLLKFQSSIVLYPTSKQKITSSKNLKHYEELLSDHPMMRVHHSNLINLQHVKGYCHQGEISLSEELCCPLGNNYKAMFLEVFGKKK